MSFLENFKIILRFCFDDMFMNLKRFEKKD